MGPPDSWNSSKETIGHDRRRDFLVFVFLLISMLRHLPWLSVILFFLTLGFVVMLFVHHATDKLDVNF